MITSSAFLLTKHPVRTKESIMEEIPLWMIKSNTYAYTNSQFDRIQKQIFSWTLHDTDLLFISVYIAPIQWKNRFDAIVLSFQFLIFWMLDTNSPRYALIFLGQKREMDFTFIYTFMQTNLLPHHQWT